MKNTKLDIDVLQIKKAALIIRAINHKLRQQMLKLIDDYEKITVTELYINLRLEQSVASQHLAILRKAGFVKATRQGKFIFYSVNYERFDKVNDLIEKFLK
ncbi:MAG: metalloregulator ArsR/SmtB family transcription factor [Chitinophagaceae bacterium]|nr:metalloregulator ArsR/SmtB family transcription factor [Chitinophagaceae bacterium]